MGAMVQFATYFRNCTVACGLAILLGGCSGPPELADQPIKAAASPVILPLDLLLAQAGPAAARGPGASLDARAARLRARAKAMQGPIGDPQTRARLLAALRAGQQ